MQLQGFIRNTQKRSVDSKKTGKSYTAYDAEIHSDDDKKIAISFGFNKPEVGEGDYVRLTANDKNGYLQVDKSTIERLEPPKQKTVNTPSSASLVNPPAGTTDGSVGNYVVQEYNRKTNPEDARRITFAAANDRAIKVVNMLLAQDALPHSKAKGKGGEAQRYQELMAAIDKVTVKMFNDAYTLRTLEVVADEGIISLKASSGLPVDPETSSPPQDKKFASLDD